MNTVEDKTHEIINFALSRRWIPDQDYSNVITLLKADNFFSQNSWQLIARGLFFSPGFLQAIDRNNTLRANRLSDNNFEQIVNQLYQIVEILSNLQEAEKDSISLSDIEDKIKEMDTYAREGQKTATRIINRLKRFQKDHFSYTGDRLLKIVIDIMISATNYQEFVRILAENGIQEPNNFYTISFDKLKAAIEAIRAR